MSDCLFCRMVQREIPAKVAYEDEEILAIYDIAPQAPHHLLVMPKKHIDRISSTGHEDQMLLGGLLGRAREIARKEGWEHFRMVINNGEEAGQTVFHIHLHLLSGRPMRWPPG